MTPLRSSEGARARGADAAPLLAAGLGPAFERLDGEGLLEDINVDAAGAAALVDRYIRQLGIYPTVDAAGVRWIRSSSTQVGVWTRDAGRGAVVVFEAPVLYEVPSSEDIPAVLDGLNRSVRSGAFVHDPAGARVWFRDALFANDMDLSEFARAFLDAAQVADDHDDDLAARVGGRRTLDVVEEHARDAAEAHLETLLTELQSTDPPRRMAAAQALGSRTSARVIDALTAALTDGSDDVAAAALRSLIAGPAAQSLDHVVSNLCGVAVSLAYPEHGRRQALAGLELLASEQALPAIRTAMKDPESAVRGRAARAIGGMAERGVSSRGVADALVHLLAEPDPWVIREAAGALAKVARHTPDAVTPTDALARLGPMLEEVPPWPALRCTRRWRSSAPAGRTSRPPMRPGSPMPPLGQAQPGCWPGPPRPPTPPTSSLWARSRRIRRRRSARTPSRAWRGLRARQPARS